VEASVAVAAYTLAVARAYMRVVVATYTRAEPSALAVVAHTLVALVVARTLVVAAGRLLRRAREARMARVDWSRPYREPAQRQRPYLGVACTQAAYTRVVVCTWAPHSLALR
jgi:hypothetical protein